MKSMNNREANLTWKHQPVNQRHENGMITNLLRANYILDGTVQFAPEQLFFLQATRQHAVSGGNSYHSVRSVPIPRNPPSSVSRFMLRLSRALTSTHTHTRMSVSLFVGFHVYVRVCAPLKSLGLSRAQAMAAIQKCIAKIPPIEGELFSLSRCIGKSRSVKWLENVISTTRLIDKKRARVEKRGGGGKGLKPTPRIVNSDIRSRIVSHGAWLFSTSLTLYCHWLLTFPRHSPFSPCRRLDECAPSPSCPSDKFDLLRTCDSACVITRMLTLVCRISRGTIVLYSFAFASSCTRLSVSKREKYTHTRARAHRDEQEKERQKKNADGRKEKEGNNTFRRKIRADKRVESKGELWIKRLIIFFRVFSFVQPSVTLYPQDSLS